MQKQHQLRTFKRKSVTSGLAMLCIISGASLFAQSSNQSVSVQNLPPPADQVTGQTPVFLAVFINGEPLGLVGEFLLDMPSHEISASRGELQELGIKAAAALGGQIDLKDIDGLAYQYNHLDQSIEFTLAPQTMATEVISASRASTFEAADPSFGAVLNYNAMASFTHYQGAASRSNISIGFDGRIFAPFGNLRSSGVFAATDTGDNTFTRLETTFDMPIPSRAMRFSAGDVTSSSLSWTRPIRIGGLQFRRDFSIRPDIVTTPLLRFEDVAAMPSTVDVFIKNNRVFSGQAPVGPYVIEDIPLIDGNGQATILVEDQNGEVRQKQVSFFASDSLLKPGLLDFSFEIGHAREAFGSESDQYGRDLLYSATAKYGLSPTLTLQGHVEGKSDLVFAGFGLSGVWANRVEYTIAAGGSRHKDASGGFIFGTARTEINGWKIQGSMQRAQDDVTDLAQATALDYLGAASAAGSDFVFYPEAQDVLTISMPSDGWAGSFGASFVHSEKNGTRDLIAAVGYTHRLRQNNGVFNASAAYNAGDSSATLSVGYSMDLGRRSSGYARVRNDSVNGTTVSTGVHRALSDGVGDFGYDVRAESDQIGNRVVASGSYRTRLATVQGLIQQSRGSTRVQARAEGAIATVGGQFVLGNRVDDAFAIVDTGQMDIPIYLNNRPVSVTGRGGKALINGLSSYFPNRVSVAPGEVGDRLSYSATAMDVIPAHRSGVFVDFGGEQISGQLALVLRAKSGAFVPLGTTFRINNQAEDYFVGYDGVAVINDIEARNRIDISYQGARCQLDFVSPDRRNYELIATLEVQLCH